MAGVEHTDTPAGSAAQEPDDIARIERELTVLASRARTIHVSKPAGQFELERAAYGILLRLAEEGPMRLGRLAHRMAVDASTITRQVQGLERLGLVEREVDQADRRAFQLGLTEDGRSAVADVQGRRKVFLARALGDWGDDDRRLLGRLLERLNGDIDDLIDQLTQAADAAEAGTGVEAGRGH